MFIRDTLTAVGTNDTKIHSKEDSSGYDSVRNLQQIIDDIRLLSNSTVKQPPCLSLEASLYGLPTYCEYLQNSVHFDNNNKFVKKKKLFSHKKCQAVQKKKP